MHHYSFHIKDYMADTSHLDPLEDIAHRRMMDWLYLNERPLPLDVNYIAKLIRMPDEYDRITFVLREFYEEGTDGYTHSRIDEELTKIYVKSEKARESVNKRWERQKRSKSQKTKENKNSDTNVLPTKYEGNTTHNPIPNTQYISSFDEFWKIWPYKKAKEDAKKAWKKLPVETQRIAYKAVKPWWSHQKPDFYINPASWLNGKRWTDEFSSQAATVTTMNVRAI